MWFRSNGSYIAIDKASEFVWAALVTCTVNVAVPAIVGVPEIVPALDRLSPAGKPPELIAQL
jgi:heme exporter protein D